jgi:hypothetical protein
MAKKISAIVIPAVIDTTGIDKGINSIKTKLSGVRGSIGTRNSGTGGVGGGGNFGAGLPHYGGSAVAVGAAAAAGGVLGAGGGGGGSTAKSEFQLRMERGNPLHSMSFQRALQQQKDAASNRFSTMIHRAGVNVNRRANYSYNKLIDDGVPPGTDNFQMRTNNIARMRSLGSGLNRFGASTGRGYSSVVNGSLGDLGRSAASNFRGENGRVGALGLTIGLGGMAAAANAARKNFTRGGIKANFSDLSNLEGNPELYERAAAIKRRTYGPSGMPTFAQSMVLGAEEFRGKGGGGNAENLASKTDTLLAKTGNLLGQSLESNAGIILGAYEGFRNSPWGGGIKMVERLAKIFN